MNSQAITTCPGTRISRRGDSSRPNTTHSVQPHFVIVIKVGPQTKNAGCEWESLHSPRSPEIKVKSSKGRPERPDGAARGKLVYLIQPLRPGAFQHP